MQTRLLALMLTDMSGYTAFSARADRPSVTAAVRQQQQLILPLIQQFRGTLVKWIGDAALATFVSATDAVLCGRAIQAVFVESAERSNVAIAPQVKIVVHAGDVMLDADGDIYGDAVNFLARMEKAAEPDEVFFSEAVRRVISPGEIPYEEVGEFQFKGIAEHARVYRTCFGLTPVVRERVVLVQTNFMSVQELADRHGWDAVHPVLDGITGAMLEAARRHSGTNRGTLQVGSFFTFGAVTPALEAIDESHREIARIRSSSSVAGTVGLRVGLHFGTMHLMKHTMMGRDIDIVRTLSALGSTAKILLSKMAVDVAVGEGLPGSAFESFGEAHMRECGSKRRWLARYPGIELFALNVGQLRLPTPKPRAV